MNESEDDESLEFEDEEGDDEMTDVDGEEREEDLVLRRLPSLYSAELSSQNRRKRS